MTEPQSGQQILHYRVVRKLGQGGMGAVYLAEDTKLQRQVALKFLPADMISDPERLKRFEREAQTVAALNHPNIVTIYSVEEDNGVPFIAMELVDGKSLAELIPAEGQSLETFFELAIPIADAVSAAHERGITHRDLKPGNIMVGSDGRVKVLDFGLAKLLQDSAVTQATSLSTQTLTKTGSALGTVTYMAPEQLRGKAPDQRADIFSLGIVFYQMASGQNPFQGETSAEVISSILRDAPPPVTDLKIEVPSHLGRIVKRCLEKNPSRRYQSAADLRTELAELKREIDSGAVFEEDAKTQAIKIQRASRRTLTATVGIAGVVVVLGLMVALWALFGKAAGDQEPNVADMANKTIAVLPLSNVGEPAEETFSEGLNEELSTELTALLNLRVVSRATAKQQFDPDVSTREIGEILGADYLVLGSVRWGDSGNQTPTARTTLQVIRVDDDIQVWSDSYDRDLFDGLAVQSEIAQHVVRAIGAEVFRLEEGQLPPEPELAMPPTMASGSSKPTRESPPPRAATTPPAARSQQPRPESRVTKIEESQVLPEQEVVQPTPLRLAVELTTFEPEGVLTLYADSQQVLSEDFLFESGKKGLLGRKKAAGTLTAQLEIPSTTRSLRIYLLVGSESKLVTLEPDLTDASSKTLSVVLNRKGELEATLQ